MLFRFQAFVLRHQAEIRVVSLIVTTVFAVHFASTDPLPGG